MLEKFMDIEEKILTNERLTYDDGVRLMKSSDILELGHLADMVRKKMVGDNAYFNCNLNINYTNICVSGCSFCAFWRSQKDESNYLLDKKTIFNKIKEAIKLGATQILMQGGLHPTLKLNYYTDLLKSIKAKFLFPKEEKFKL